MDKDTIFNLPMEENDAGAGTIGEYFREMLCAVWREGEGFSGKRPFGNSGWQNDVYKALVKGGMVRGLFDEDGYLDEVDDRTAYKLVEGALKTFGL